MDFEFVEILDFKDFLMLQKYDLMCVMVNSYFIEKGFNKCENYEVCLVVICSGIDVVFQVGYFNVIIFLGNWDGQFDEEGFEFCIEVLKSVVGYVEQKKVMICMELLNSKVDYCDYMVDGSEWFVEFVQCVGLECFKIFYDIYYVQVMEGDVIVMICKYYEFIGYYYMVGVLGCNEIDDSQEFYYFVIMKVICVMGYKGFVGQEFIFKGLDLIVLLCDVVCICDVQMKRGVLWCFLKRWFRRCWLICKRRLVRLLYSGRRFWIKSFLRSMVRLLDF